MSNVFTHYLRVRYSECDPQQVVFNARYAEYVDVAATEFTRALWGGYENVLEMGVDTQVVNLTIDWRAPAHFDEVLAVQVEVAHMGNTSYSLAMTFINCGSSTLIATAKVTYVFINGESHTKTPIPAKLRASLERGAEGQSSNHAGDIPDAKSASV